MHKYNNQQIPNNIEIYTDGSCLGNPGKGGWGFISNITTEENNLNTDNNHNRSGNHPHTTNNQMELTAVIEALKFCKDLFSTQLESPRTILIYTDSKYVKDGSDIWMKNWKKNHWINSSREPVKNRNLWEPLDKLRTELKTNNIDISFNWVKAHSGHPMNEKVDQLARAAATMTPQELDKQNTQLTNMNNKKDIPNKLNNIHNIKHDNAYVFEILKTVKAVQFGCFRLSSGFYSNIYIQCALLFTNPGAAALVSSDLITKIKDSFKNIDYIVAPAMGGVILAYELSRQLNVPSVFVERDKNGKFKMKRFSIPQAGSKILIIDDVITKGGSISEVYDFIKNETECQVLGAACIVDRSSNNSTKLNFPCKHVYAIKIDAAVHADPNDLENNTNLEIQYQGSNPKIK